MLTVKMYVLQILQWSIIAIAIANRYGANVLYRVNN